MANNIAIVWFRRDLRLSDNPALHDAIQHFDSVLPVYLHCPAEDGDWKPGEASDWWLHHSLAGLQKSLQQRGANLMIRQGDNALQLLRNIIDEHGAKAVLWNRLYTPAAVARDSRIKKELRAAGVEAESFNSSLFHEPWVNVKLDGTPYRVFTAWWVRTVASGFGDDPLPAPEKVILPSAPGTGLAIEELALLPSIRWYEPFHDYWAPGESFAMQQLKREFTGVLDAYATDRDRPDRKGTSRLSPHLHFGEISPRQVVHEITKPSQQLIQAKGKSSLDRYVAELGWRDFAACMLFHFPHTADAPLNRQFDRFPWKTDYADDLCAWQQGKTGIPIVDAGMRELWHTGWMHNRVRMIVASFLTKNLLIPWQEGAAWFWDTLVDADLASNALGWQWVAGCGADAAPYFRIFNPVLQGEKFDPEGEYVRQWIPELKHVQRKQVHKPWSLQDNPYLEPIVDLKQSRERALECYRSMNGSQAE